MPRQFSISTKIALATLVLMVVIGGGVGYAVFAPHHRMLVERDLEALGHEAAVTAMQLIGDVETLREDVFFVSRTPPVHGILRARQAGGVDPVEGLPEARWRARLTAIFTEFIKSHPRYAQARFIGVEDGGREIVRVERLAAQGIVVTTPEAELQQKAAERYLVETFKRKPGEVYLSEITLNREHGRVTVPHAPMLRAGMAVHGPSGKVFGAVVVNMGMRANFAELRTRLPAHRDLYLTNDDGDYLLHPNEGETFGFDLGRRRRIQELMPSVASVFARGGGETIPSFRLDLEGPTRLSVRYAAHLRKVHFDPDNPERYLGLVLAAPLETMLGQSLAVRDQSTVMAGILIVLGMVLLFLHARLLTRRLSQITASADRVALGDYDVPLPEGSQDEIGTLARSFRAMIGAIEERNRTLERQNRQKTQLAELAELMRGDQELPALCQAVIAHLARSVEAPLGAVYVVDDDGDLRLLGSYAFKRRKGVVTRFSPGEGLVGQGALERRTIVVSHVPEDYVAVSSGLGERVPGALLVCPMLRDDIVVGVVELGGFEPFDDAAVALIEEACAHIAIAVTSGLGRERMRELLDESRRQSAELKAQQEELRATNEQLEEQAQVLSQSEEELKAQSAALTQANHDLERKNADVEQQRRAVEQAHRDLERKAGELAQASRYKSEFLANMSHELRTPLNSLLILAKNFTENPDGNLTLQQIECAQIMHGSGVDLLALINDILDLSRVEAGKLDVRAAEICLDALQELLRERFEPLAVERSLALSIERAPELEDRLVSDEQRLVQILSNLIGNALKFTERGRVEVQIRRPSEEELARVGQPAVPGIAFEVRDTGPGIPPGERQAVFGAFQQLDGSTSRRHGGTGLGLSISQQLAGLLGGGILLESEVGKGSCFTLCLPLQLAAAEPGDASAASQPSDAVPPPVPAPVDNADDVPAVLLIEDDRQFTRVLSSIVREGGYRCLEASNGREGLALARAHCPRGIILDLGLPDMDGLAVLEALRGDPATRTIPIHVVSGRAEAESGLDGSVGFLTKPASRKELDRIFARFAGALPQGAKRVLLVEDDPGDRRVVEGLVAHWGAEVVACSAQAAGEALAAGGFDCVILNLPLPDTSGAELLRSMRERLATMPPVIVYTASELSHGEHAQLRKYAESIVVKGASAEDRLSDEIALFLHRVETGRRPEPRSENPLAHSGAESLAGRRVLLVDDDLRNTFALSRVLDQHGIEVELADNGRVALEKLAATKGIELVLMDVMMPVMDGYETMRRIRRSEEWRKLPIIALTAKAMQDDRARCIEAGASDYLSKPVDLEKLLSMLRVWLSAAAAGERRGRKRPWSGAESGVQRSA